MRKFIPTLLCTVGLALLCQGLAVSGSQKGEEKKKSPQKASAEELEKLYKQLIKDLGSPGFEKRDMAYKELLKNPRSVGELRRALGAPGLSPETKRRVENLLEELDVEKLLEKLEGPQEQVDAAYATLTKFGLNDGEELLKIYKAVDDKSKAKLAVVFGKVRAAAIERKRNDLAEIMEEALLRCLREPNHKIVAATTWALTNVGPPSKKSIPVFIGILEKKESSWEARSVAAYGLSEFGPSASQAIPVLLKCLNTKIENTRMRAEEKGLAAVCSALASVGPKDERVSAALIEAVLNRKESKYVRTTAILSAANLGERSQVIVPELMEVLKNRRGTQEVDDRMLRHYALVALGKLKLSKENIPAIIQIAVDPKEDNFFRPEAVKALIHSREMARAAWQPLFRSLQDHDSDPPVKEIVVALREIAPPAGADRIALARELRRAFDAILDRRPSEDMAKEMDKTVKAVEKNK